VIPSFFKLLDRNRNSSPAGKHSGALPGIRSVWAFVEIYVGYENKYASQFDDDINMACGDGSSSITSGGPLGIVIQIPRCTLLPPCTSLFTSHAHTLLAAAPEVSASSLAHHHRTIWHLAFVGNKEPHSTHQTNISGADDDYDP
jgi:hypothetical protein